MAKEIKDLAASVRERLRNHSKAHGEDFQSVLVRYGAERFLYRMSISTYSDRFLLKGAALFSLWFDQPHRPTKDIDLLGFGDNDIPPLEKIAKEICQIDAEDGVRFDPESVNGTLIREEAAYEGVRIKLEGWLGSARLPIQVDVGFGDAVTPGPAAASYPTLLDMPAPQLRVYPKETVVAEKFEAMVKLGMANSRMKDFWDVNFMIHEFNFQGAALQKALKATFRNRQTSFPEQLPIALTDEFAQDKSVLAIWTGFISRNHIDRHNNLAEVITNLQAFFEPIIAAETYGKQFTENWKTGTGWN